MDLGWKKGRRDLQGKKSRMDLGWKKQNGSRMEQNRMEKNQNVYRMEKNVSRMEKTGMDLGWKNAEWI